jgi:hypothetical protein
MIKNVIKYLFFVQNAKLKSLKKIGLNITGFSAFNLARRNNQNKFKIFKKILFLCTHPSKNSQINIKKSWKSLYKRVKDYKSRNKKNLILNKK